MVRIVEDFTGREFTRLVVVSRADDHVSPNGTKFKRWNCFCKCNPDRVYPIREQSLKNGVKSCGCLHREELAARNTTHGHSAGRKNTKALNAYKNMIKRCTNPNYRRWDRYGGRGIKVCDRWLESFENFLADMGEPAPDMTLDREDNDGDYCPDNCRWITQAEQTRNTSHNVAILFRGESRTLTEWAQITGIHRTTIRTRIETWGWSVERALTEGVKERRQSCGTYKIWLHLKDRCHNPNCRAYSDYGGRGISVCDRWLESYENFAIDVGERPSPHHTLDRIDNSKGYSPDNCQWSTKKEQARNRRSNVLLSFQGQTRTIAEWVEITGLTQSVLQRRTKDGWSAERALTTPIRR